MNKLDTGFFCICEGKHEENITIYFILAIEIPIMEWTFTPFFVKNTHRKFTKSDSLLFIRSSGVDFEWSKLVIRILLDQKHNANFLYFCLLHDRTTECDFKLLLTFFSRAIKSFFTSFCLRL